VFLNRAGRGKAWLTCALLLFCACSALTAAGCTTVKPSAKTKVSATIEPLADFCRNVGGNLVEVETLIPPGASSHVFEPTASQFVFVSQAKVFVMVGLDLETWAAGVIKKVGSAGMVVVVTADAAPKDKLIKAGAFNGEKGSPGAPYDPHIWLDPTIAMYQVDAIRDGFIKADPAHAAAYRANAAAYNAKLAALDREIMAKTATFKSRAFVALHPGWTYFSRRYAITQAGAVQEFPEQEPSGKQVADIVKAIKAKHIKVIFAEPQISPKAAQVIASEIPGVRVLYLDPLGDPAKPEVSTYIKMMEHNVAVMAEVLQ
jgi:zinc transport system substrate-binding protein